MLRNVVVESMVDHILFALVGAVQVFRVQQQHHIHQLCLMNLGEKRYDNSDVLIVCSF